MSDIVRLCVGCKEERQDFRLKGKRESPNCAELLRRSLNPQERDEPARRCVVEIFEPEIRKTLKKHIFGAINRSGNDAFKQLENEIDDLVQVVFSKVFGHQETLSSLIGVHDSPDNLNFLMAWVNTTCRNEVAERKRQITNDPSLDENEPSNPNDEVDLTVLKSVLPNEPNFADRLIESVFANKVLHYILESIKIKEKEWVALEEMFVYGRSAKEIATDYPNHFRKDSDVYQTIENVRNRSHSFRHLLKFEIAPQNVRTTASLPVNTEGGLDSPIMKPNLPCQFNEGYLLDYLNGHLSAEVRREIEQSPACMEAVNVLKEEVAWYRSMLRTVVCPDMELLVAYQEGWLEGEEKQSIARHLEKCPHCRQDLEMFETIDAEEKNSALHSSAPQSKNFVQEVVEALKEEAKSFQDKVNWVRAVFRPQYQLAQQLRGGVGDSGIPRALPGVDLKFESPQVHIRLRTSEADGQERAWSLVGQTRTPEGLLFTDVKKVVLQQLEQSELPLVEATAKADGTFTFEGLQAGSYSVSVHTALGEIATDKFIVGDEA